MLIVNPGSKIAKSGNGWTNTLETATATANDWLRSMRNNNINEVSIVAVLLQGIQMDLPSLRFWT